jgi:antitoxin component YwqK of YwqJK toxin-antitoxin module
MDLINQLAQKYLSSDGYVFTSFNLEWMIVLRKYDYRNCSLLSKILNCDIIELIKDYMLYTNTDEHRSDVKDPSYAIFCGDKFLVVDIMHKFKGTTKTNLKTKTLKYSMGNIVPHFDRKKNMISITNAKIYYFKSADAAFYYKLNKLDNGLWKEWDRNGQQILECMCTDGKLNGKYKKWHSNGQPSIECTFKNRKPDGEYKEWRENGQFQIECMYKNGEKDGLYRSWHENGQLAIECICKDDQLDGDYKCWYNDGLLACNCIYKNGQKSF